MMNVRFFHIILLLALSCPARLIAQVTIEKDISLKTPTGTLSGSLIGSNADVLAIVIAGSGPTDRYGNNALGVKANSYKLLANALAANNISVLLYDKRGIGQSASAMKKEQDLRFEDYIKDASDWVSFMQKDQHFKKIVLIGHSEGALISTAATQNNTLVKGLVLLAGAGRNFDEIIAAQLKQNPNNPQKILDESAAILDSLKKGLSVKHVQPYFNALYRPSVQPYLISMLRYSPAELLKKIKIPTLIIQGDADKQITIQDAELLASANKDAKKVIIQGMNHLLKTVTDDQDNQISYMEPNRPLDAELIRYITGFIKKDVN